LISLLDVNCLISLLDSDHAHHSVIASWFLGHVDEGWSTCPLTENGLIRVTSQPSYPSGRRSPREAAAHLRQLKFLYRETHRFWSDSVSLTDESLFLTEHIRGARDITDAYLLGLAHQHGARLVSFDRDLPWQAIKGGSARLVLSPLLQ
jgi:hypothetical protein